MDENTDVYIGVLKEIFSFSIFVKKLSLLTIEQVLQECVHLVHSPLYVVSNWIRTRPFFRIRAVVPAQRWATSRYSSCGE